MALTSLVVMPVVAPTALACSGTAFRGESLRASPVARVQSKIRPCRHSLLRFTRTRSSPRTFRPSSHRLVRRRHDRHARRELCACSAERNPVTPEDEGGSPSATAEEQEPEKLEEKPGTVNKSPFGEGMSERETQLSLLNSLIGPSEDALKAEAEAKAAAEQAAKEKEAAEVQGAKGEADAGTVKENEEDPPLDPAELFPGLAEIAINAPPAEDVKRMKEEVFKNSSYWVTDTEPYGDEQEGITFKGNLRGDYVKVYEECKTKMKEVFDDKYQLYMFEERLTLQDLAELEDPNDLEDVRVNFAIVPTEMCMPEPTNGAQLVVALIAAVLTGASAIQLGLAAEVTKLPPEVLSFLESPDALDPNVELPVDFDVVEYINQAIPISRNVLLVLLSHEAAHRAVAALRGVRLSLPFAIPNAQLGSFGAVTQFKSLLANRKDLFDISVSGPLVGLSISTALVVAGLLASVNGDVDVDPTLVPVPSQLLQGSFLLGALSRVTLGYEAVHKANVIVSPLLLAGWCGMVSTCLNLLPVGRLDGGRMVQSALGRPALGYTSFFTYVGLGLGLLGGSLSIPWGFFVLFLQREPEKPCLDDVSEVGEERVLLTWIVLLIVTLVLMPLGPDLAEEWGVGLNPMNYL